MAAKQIIRSHFSRFRGLGFVVVFAGIGMYLLLSSHAATGTTYYLSPSGNDSNPCTQSAPCKTLERGYQVATCGNTVLIAGGDYSAAQQQMMDDPTKDACAAPVTMEGMPGQTAVFGEINASNTRQGPSWITFNNLSDTGLCGGSGGTNANCPDGDRFTLTGGSHVTLDNITGGTVFVGGEKQLLIQNSNFGPCYNIKGPPPPIGNCMNDFKIDSAWEYTNGGPLFYTDGVTIAHNTIHDYINDAPTPNNHWTCVFIRGGQNITFDSNHFHVCEHYGIEIQPVNPGAAGGIPGTNTTIENNWFDEARNNAMYEGGGTQHTGIALNQNGGQVANLLIRYNSFSSDEGVVNASTNASESNIRIYGNIGDNNFYNNSWGASYTSQTAHCIAGVTYGYNLWNTSTCSSTDTVSGTLPYVNQAAGAEDFHLNACGTAAHNLVQLTSSDLTLSYDKDGNARAGSGSTDAGSELKAGSCGGTPAPAPTASLTATPTSIASGQNSTLSWSSTNATSCSGSGFSASGTSGTSVVKPTSTTTYSLTCSGGGGSVTAKATISVTTGTSGTGSSGGSGTSSGGSSTGKTTVNLSDSGTSTLSGTVVLNSGVRDAKSAQYYIDGKPLSSNTINTASLPDGTHTVTVKATTANGQVVTETKTITVNNHHSWLKNLELRHGKVAAAGAITGSAFVTLALIVAMVWVLVLRPRHMSPPTAPMEESDFGVIHSGDYSPTLPASVHNVPKPGDTIRPVEKR